MDATKRKHLNNKIAIRNYLRKWVRMMEDYELIKAGNHPLFRKVSDFYKAHDLSRQTFVKYYHRWKAEGKEGLLPRSPGRPRYVECANNAVLTERVLDLRKQGRNRYEMFAILQPEMEEATPSPATLYRICQRFDMGKLTKPMKEEKRRIIKTRAGELGHVDVHYMQRGIAADTSQRFYLVCVIDACTRIAWAEVVEDNRSLTVMFATLKILNLISSRYRIRFEEIISDNGREFASRNNTTGHPFERMLKELGITHRYTRPFRPQTNGKVERFWRTLNTDLIDGAHFDNIEHFKDELQQYLVYYNECRLHQALGGKTPKQINDSVNE